MILQITAQMVCLPKKLNQILNMTIFVKGILSAGMLRIKAKGLRSLLDVVAGGC